MADGINKLIAMKKESSWGAKAGASGARLYPRTTGNFQFEVGSYTSNSIRPSQQLGDARNDSGRATGSLDDDLACGNFDELMAAFLRRDFTGSVTTGALTNITVAAAAPNFTRAAGSFITDGFRRGMLIKPSGLTASADNVVAVIVDVTATTMTALKIDKTVYTAQASGTSNTIAQFGKWTYTPQTGHTDDSFTVEEWHSDISVSTITRGQQVNTIGIEASPNSMAKFTSTFMGKDGDAATGIRYFTSPTAVSGNASMSSAQGLLFFEGVGSCRFSAFKLDGNANITQEAAVMCSGMAGKSRGKVMVSGSATLFLDDAVFLNYLKAETELKAGIVFYAPDGNALCCYMPRMKLKTATKDDGEKLIMLSITFDALEYVGTSTGEVPTTLIISDTTL